MNGLAGLGGLWNSIRAWLFPVLEDELGELDEKHKEFVTVCELCAPGADMSAYTWVGNGQPPKSRLALWKAFVAKAVWDFPTTRDLIDAVRHRPTLRRLCGWETLGEVPSEAALLNPCAATASISSLRTRKKTRGRPESVQIQHHRGLEAANLDGFTARNDFERFVLPNSARLPLAQEHYLGGFARGSYIMPARMSKYFFAPLPSLSRCESRCSGLVGTGTPTGSRTPVSRLRIWHPRPLDDGGANAPAR